MFEYVLRRCGDNLSIHNLFVIFKLYIGTVIHTYKIYNILHTFEIHTYVSTLPTGSIIDKT